MWGLYDTRDHCWIGDDAGPFQYEDSVENGLDMSGELKAKCASAVLDARMGTLGRYRAREYDGSGTKLKDAFTPPRTATDALERLEEP
jgi:hypothetical protein